MKIRLKIILVVLPLIIASLIFAEGIIWFGVTRDITLMAEESLDFKLYQLETYAENQWSLLIENGYAENENMIGAAKSAVEIYASTLAVKQSERIFALDNTGSLVMKNGTINITPEEYAALIELVKTRPDGILNAPLGGKERVLKTSYFIPFRWQIFVSDERESFFSAVDRITAQSLVTLLVASILAIVLLVMLARFLTSPLARIVKTMQRIISSSNLSSRAEVVYNDEIGSLAQNFNFMLDELEKSYKQTKKYAFESTLAQKKEMRIREIFQKYVPHDVIEQFFASPESMLRGETRELVILFSDIRGFTTISETMRPEDVVSCLNRYFSGQVDTVFRYNGIVDKYIGDALMAFWGAPLKTENDALSAVFSALDMLDILAEFNVEQRQLGKPEFSIGIGINMGNVTVGNIGNDRKMNYTIIGDAVNLASRVEELTKEYQQQLLITEYVYQKVKDNVITQLIGNVVVRGRSEPVNVYTVRRK
ncbi:MAG: adenylate/guanylate cyclase domain-containing protein [Spirochaetaceae bacterium]|jgi:class 3 adenylate cyclase/HAMP domain-containing protein|nr:adenylate/guanylate cyclase domain-containing protein [Spirochaetaceae bacterium]